MVARVFVTRPTSTSLRLASTASRIPRSKVTILPGGEGGIVSAIAPRSARQRAEAQRAENAKVPICRKMYRISSNDRTVCRDALSGKMSHAIHSAFANGAIGTFSQGEDRTGKIERVEEI